MLGDQTAQRWRSKTYTQQSKKKMQNQAGKCIFTVDMMLAMAEPRYAQKKAAEQTRKDEFSQTKIQQTTAD